MNLPLIDPPQTLTMAQRGALATIGLGFLILFLATFGVGLPPLLLWVALGLLLVGPMAWAWLATKDHPPGVRNDGVFFSSVMNRGAIGWVLAVVLTGFYVCLYWLPEALGLGKDGGGNSGLVALFDPLSTMIKGKPAGQWFVYGTLYTVAILAMGVRSILKYRHNRYAIARTLSVVFFQLIFAYSIPEILEGTRKDSGWYDRDYKNIWPLDYDFFAGWHLDAMLNDGTLGLISLGWGVALVFVVTPVLTYFYGKRWYCSWVCGCGGLAETMGDPFRQLSDKSLKAWKVERWLIHSVMVFVVLMTATTLYGYVSNTGEIFGLSIYHTFAKPYGFLIGAAFSGVVGTGFYPLLGSRVWCRFGCPMAGYLGLLQRFFSRFRITTNGGQCISCGNCSTYCEMGIDVRAYAQRGANVVRASCVGCGICAQVCPRGVLRLENGPLGGRLDHGTLSVGAVPEAHGTM